MSTATLPTLPAADLLDGLYEVADGVVTEKDVSAFALWIANRLIRRIDNFAAAHGLGGAFVEMIYILDAITDLRRRPDAAFVSAAKWPIDAPPPATGDWAIIPDLAVEVASPSNAFHDLIRKMDEHFAHGVAEVWIIVPERRVVCVYHSPRESTVLRAGDLLTTPLLPNWSVLVGDLIPENAVASGEPE